MRTSYTGKDLTLTSVVFEFAPWYSVCLPRFHLTLTSVVFEFNLQDFIAIPTAYI
ncbi:hypothetical protein [Megamonas funiformis]